ncbi:MAG: T9SS type A sorting domain-containing protein [Agriterribacter sp.]
MKKHLWVLTIICPFFMYAQQTYTWVPSSGSWSVASNWSPQRTSPSANDILKFNASATVTDISSETIGKISVYNNATVTFSTNPPGNILTVGNASISAPHFAVEAGSSLHFTGSNPLSVNITSGSSGKIAGVLRFAGAAHRLTAVSVNAIVFSSGSQFIADASFSGNAFGNATANKNSVLFESGSTYIYKDGANPFALTAPDAVTTFSNGSIYSHRANGAGPSLAGRSYGNLYIEGSINFSGIGSSRDCIIQNDFNVLSGNFYFKPNSLGSPTGNFNIYGNILVSGSANIEIGSSYMSGAVQMLGSNQKIGGGSGNITIKNLLLNNTSTMLLSNLSVSDTLNLQHGKMITASTALLTLTDTASIKSCAHNYDKLPYTNIGCDDAYIEGPIQKTGLNNNDFAFPVGINGKLRPLLLRNASGSFTVLHKREDPYMAVGSTMGSGIHHVSHLEYWTINGTGSAKVELTFFDPNSGGVTDMQALRVVRYNGTAWANQDVSNYQGAPGANGSVTSASVAEFGSFTLGASSDYPNNPLPQKIFDWVASYDGSKVKLEWEIADIDQYKGYYVEKSTDGQGFKELTNFIPAKNTNKSCYYIYDSNINGNKCEYRIRIIGYDGQAYFSNIQTIYSQHNGRLIVYPNPAREKIFIKIPDSRSISDWVIVNISGSVVKRVNIKRQTTVELDILNLLPGIYFIKSTQLSSPVIVKFIKF